MYLLSVLLEVHPVAHILIDGNDDDNDNDVVDNYGQPLESHMIMLTIMDNP